MQFYLHGRIMPITRGVAGTMIIRNGDVTFISVPQNLSDLSPLATANVKCDGATDDTGAMNGLLSSIGVIPTTLVFPNSGRCLLGTITFPSNITLDFTQSGAIQVVTNQTVTILGNIIQNRRQIFFNAISGQGTIDFTGGYAIEEVYPEWWGALPGITALINTPAIQSAIYAAFGGGPTSLRTNGSALSKYNRILFLSGLYDLNDELKLYNVNNFLWRGVGKLYSGLKQRATNKRILDGQCVAYGVFDQLRFETDAPQTVPLIDLDNDHTHGADLSPQFITFNDCQFFGSGLGHIGVLIAKHGGDAQGSNINFYNCAASGFKQAAAQLGGNNTGVNAGRFYAYNALCNGWYNGDIQACPQYGLASYAGQWIVKDVTMENDSSGFGSQTGFDVYCESAQEACFIENLRSEGHKLAAGSNIRVTNSRTIFQATQWYSASRNQTLAGISLPTGTIISGTGVGGDGAYYRITTGGVFGGLGITSATGGSATSINVTGASWTMDAFIGYRATIIGGSGRGTYGIITTNASSTLTCSAGFITNYVNSPENPWVFVFPDSTSTFVIEPNWGTQTTSGAATWTSFPFNVIEGDGGGAASNIYLDRVSAPGGKIKAGGYFKDVLVSRPDWHGVTFPLDDLSVLSQYNNIRVTRPDSALNTGNGSTRELTWGFGRNGPATNVYSDYSQFNVGTLSIVWSHGGAGGGTALEDAWVGLNGFRLPTFTFAALPSFPPYSVNGVLIYCKDAKNMTDDGATFDSIAVSGGHGAMLLRQNGNWRVH